jgi:hypothetical protein
VKFDSGPVDRSNAAMSGHGKRAVRRPAVIARFGAGAGAPSRRPGRRTDNDEPVRPPLSLEVSLEESSAARLRAPRTRGHAVESLRGLLDSRLDPASGPESIASLSLDPASLSLDAMTDSVEVLPLDHVPWAPPVSVADIPLRSEGTASGTWDDVIEISDPESSGVGFLDWLETGVQPPIADDSGDSLRVPSDPDLLSADGQEFSEDVEDSTAETEEAIEDTLEAIAETQEAIAETQEVIAETIEDLGGPDRAARLTDEGPEQTEELAPLTDEGPEQTEELAPLTDEGPEQTEEFGPSDGELGSMGDLQPGFPGDLEVQPTGQEPPVADSAFDIPVEAPERTHAETQPSLEPPQITVDEPTLRDEPSEQDEPTEPASLQDLLAAAVAANVSLDLGPPEPSPDPAEDEDEDDEDTEYVTSRVVREGPWVAQLHDEILPWPLAVVGLMEVLPGEWSPPAGHSLSSPMPAGAGTQDEELELELDLGFELELDLESVADVEGPQPVEELAPEQGDVAPAADDSELAPPGLLDTPVSADVAADSIDSAEAAEDWLRGMNGQAEESVGYDMEIVPSVTMEDEVPRPDGRDGDLPTQLTSKVELERALAQLEGADVEPEVSSPGAPTRPIPPTGDGSPTRRIEAEAASEAQYLSDDDAPPTLVERPQPARSAALGAEMPDEDDDELVTEVRSVADLEAALAVAGLDSSEAEAPPVVPEPLAVESHGHESDDAEAAPGPSEQPATAVVTFEPTREDEGAGDPCIDEISLHDLELDELDELDLDFSEADVDTPHRGVDDGDDEDRLDIDVLADGPFGGPLPSTPPPSLTVAAVVSTLQAVRHERRTIGGGGRLWLELDDPTAARSGGGGVDPIWLDLTDPGPHTAGSGPRIELDDNRSELTSLTLEGTEDEPPAAADVVADGGAVRVELALSTAPPEPSTATRGVAVAPAEPIRSWTGKAEPDGEPATDLVALAGSERPPGTSEATGTAGSEAAKPEQDWQPASGEAGDPDDEAPMSPYYVDTQPVTVPEEVRRAARVSIGAEKDRQPRKKRRRRKKK